MGGEEWREGSEMASDTNEGVAKSAQTTTSAALDDMMYVTYVGPKSFDSPKSISSIGSTDWTKTIQTAKTAALTTEDRLIVRQKDLCNDEGRHKGRVYGKMC
jgi:hypothetical protein